LALIQVVYTTPLLSAEEIAAFCALTPASATRLLYDLLRLRYLEFQQTRGGRRWRLSDPGLRWIAALLDVSIQHLAQGTKETLIQRGVPLLERTIQHTAGIYNFLARLHRDATVQGHQVVWWETGSWCERRYLEHGTWQSLMPDAAFEYQAGTRRLRAWLEWDEGTMTGGALTAKLRTYAQYLRSREWAREQRALPLLLIVTPEPSQERRIRQLYAMVTAPGLRLFTTTATRLTDHNLLDPIWLPIHADPSTSEQVRHSWLK
jgi:hypothetical protein